MNKKIKQNQESKSNLCVKAKVYFLYLTVILFLYYEYLKDIKTEIKTDTKLT